MPSYPIDDSPTFAASLTEGGWMSGIMHEIEEGCHFTLDCGANHLLIAHEAHLINIESLYTEGAC